MVKIPRLADVSRTWLSSAMLIACTALTGSTAHAARYAAVSSPVCGEVLSHKTMSTGYSLQLQGVPVTTALSQRTGTIVVRVAPQGGPPGIPGCAALILDSNTGRVLRTIVGVDVRFAGVIDRHNRFVLIAAVSRGADILYLSTRTGRTTAEAHIAGSPVHLAIYSRAPRIYVGTTATPCTSVDPGCDVTTRTLDLEGRQIGMPFAGMVGAVDQIHGRVFGVLAQMGVATITARSALSGALLWQRTNHTCLDNQVRVIQQTGMVWLAGMPQFASGNVRRELKSHVPRDPQIGYLCRLSGATGRSEDTVSIDGVLGVGLGPVDEPAGVMLITESGNMGGGIVLVPARTGEPVTNLGLVGLEKPLAIEPGTGRIFYVSAYDARGAGHSTVSVLDPHDWTVRTVAHAGVVTCLAVASASPRLIVGSARDAGAGVLRGIRIWRAEHLARPVHDALLIMIPAAVY